jgi:hypothetical protein
LGTDERTPFILEVTKNGKLILSETNVMNKIKRDPKNVYN